VANIERMVVKPSDASGGYGLLMGPAASEAQITGTIAAIDANPRGWIAQPVVRLSTCPTVVGEDGELASRHVDLRPFATNDGNRVRVLPGGLTRVALVEGSLVVNSSQGGGSKDTWVLEDSDSPQVEVAPVVIQVAPESAWLPARPNAVPSHDDRLAQQERQQQQSQGVELGPVPDRCAEVASC